jgi:hypothetical protein
MNAYRAAKDGFRRTPTDLFNAGDRYPQQPGYKELGGTSQAAAEQIASAAATLRDRAFRCLGEHGPLTADETAERMGEDILAIRPRFSELYRQGAIRKTTLRRPTRSGTKATVWELAPAGDDQGQR